MPNDDSQDEGYVFIIGYVTSGTRIYEPKETKSLVYFIKLA